MTLLHHNASEVATAPLSETWEYAVFGGILRSALPFPELVPTTSGSASWEFRVVDAEPPLENALVVVGERTLGSERYWLRSSPQRLRLEYSHAGCFDISRDGRTIIWYRRDDAVLELVRSIVLGPALAIALELTGLLCLHGSAVAIGDRVIAFVGPKHHGKSTLATALTAAGARLVGDDLVPISPGAPAMVLPGVASVRLWQDTAEALGVHEICEVVIPGIKTTASGFADTALAQTSAPLWAVYVLEPVRPSEDVRACWRTRMPVAASTVALAQQAKLADGLIGLPAAGARLRAAAAVAKTVPVWTLHVVRDLSRIDHLVGQIVEWTREQASGTTQHSLETA